MERCIDLHVGIGAGLAEVFDHRARLAGKPPPTMGMCGMARKLIVDSLLTGFDVTAPICFRYQLEDFFHETKRKYEKLKLTDTEVDLALQHVLKLVRPIHLANYLPHALSLARQHNCSYQYKGIYLAVAEKRMCDLWTANSKFNPRLQFVRIVGKDRS